MAIIAVSKTAVEGSNPSGPAKPKGWAVCMFIMQSTALTVGNPANAIVNV